MEDEYYETEKKTNYEEKLITDKNNSELLKSNPNDQELSPPAEVKLTKREMDQTLDGLGRVVSSISQEVKRLRGEIVNLKDEGIILHKIPDKLIRHLQDSIPEISKELKVIILKDLDNGIKACYNNVDKLNQAAIEAMCKANEAEDSSLKKNIIWLAATLLVAIISSSASTYFMMKKFPPFVEIRADNGVKVENSNVKVLNYYEKNK